MNKYRLTFEMTCEMEADEESQVMDLAEDIAVSYGFDISDFNVKVEKINE